MSNVAVILRLIGKQRFITGVNQAKLALHGMATTVDKTGKVLTNTGRRTWLFNQALFTMRRLAYGVTLGFIGMGAVLVKWGFEFNSQMNNARVGLEGFLPSQQAISDELNKMYLLAAETPFDFPQILTGIRRLIPFTQTVGEANQLLEALTNSLSAVGSASGTFLTRATIQFTHILALGRVTGIQLNALSRDQIALLPMLAAFYHTTTANVQEMVHKGLVPAGDAIAALIAYQKTAGYQGKNFAMATRTLSGAWATFKDIVSFAMGGESKGLFEGFRNKISEVDKTMLHLIETSQSQKITLDLIARSIDQGFSPQLHIVYNTFVLLKSTLQGFVGTLYGFFYIVNKLLTPLGIFGDKTGAAARIMQVLGYWLGFNLALMVIYRTILYTVAIATLLMVDASTRETIALKAMYFWQRLTTIWWGISFFAMMLYNQGLMATTASLWALVAGEYAFLAPFFIVIAAVLAAVIVLGVLYWKWKAFHDLMNATAQFLWKWWPLLALVPIIGPLLLVIKIFSRVVGWIDKLIDGVKRLRSWFRGGGIGGFLGKAGGALLGGINPFQGLQHGGVVSSSGAFMVGEAGPEVVHLPRGAAVQPSVPGLGMGGGFALNIEPSPVIIDGRQIAEIAWKHRNDRVARR